MFFLPILRRCHKDVVISIISLFVCIFIEKNIVAIIEEISLRIINDVLEMNLNF